MSSSHWLFIPYIVQTYVTLIGSFIQSYSRNSNVYFISSTDIYSSLFGIFFIKFRTYRCVKWYIHKHCEKRKIIVVGSNVSISFVYAFYTAPLVKSHLCRICKSHTKKIKFHYSIVITYNNSFLNRYTYMYNNNVRLAHKVYFEKYNILRKILNFSKLTERYT